MPQGTRANFGDASAKQRTAREKRLESEKEAKRPEDGNGPADKEDKEEDAAARSRRGGGGQGGSPGAVLRRAGGFVFGFGVVQATTQTLRALWDPGRLPAFPLVAHETTLLAAKRVIAEAQEAMAPRLLSSRGLRARGRRAPRRPCSIYQKRGACGSCARAARTPWTRLCARTRTAAAAAAS